jgi:uncharacterized repeat protein (TIGR03803 family)
MVTIMAMLFDSSLLALSLLIGTGSPAGPKFTSLYSFDGNLGAYPTALVEQVPGTFLGTTYGGAASGSSCSVLGCGMIFRYAAGAVKVLHVFHGADGGNPSIGLVPKPGGGYYGTTYYGGSANSGTVFGFNGKSVKTFYTFGGNADGSQPDSLIVARDGTLYGTTNNAGGGSGQAFGTVFGLTPRGTLSTLKTYSGKNPSEGIVPVGIMQANDGSFYGIVGQGGNTKELGSAFHLSASGQYATLHTFHRPDGGILQSAVVQASDGNFYGVASLGGNPAYCKGNFAPGCGTVFRMTPTGALTVLHAFTGADGAEPYAALRQAKDGYLYGSTNGGGHACPGSNYGCGTIFRISLSGRFSTLHFFLGKDGENPSAALIQGSDGALYGTTDRGGKFGFGTIFKLVPPPG